MADRSDARPARKGPYSDRAAKRRSEPGLSRLTGHVIQLSATSITLTAAGLTLLDHPIPKLTVLTASALGSAVVGRAYERHGRETGLREGFEAGRRQGRAEAMRETASSRRGIFPGRARTGDRDRGGR